MRYVAQLAKLLRAGTRMLLITLEYRESQMAGPPFAVPAEEVTRLYAPQFEVREIAREDILPHEARLRAKGLTELVEVCYRSRAPLSRERQDMAESRSSGRYLAPALVVCAAATASHAGASRAAELTIDRLFDAPALAGPTIVGLRISPDGSSVTYLQGKPEDKDRLDLWAYDLKERRARLLVDSRALAPVDAKLSDEEIGRRERQRTAALSGILEYSFAPSGQALLFPLDGRLYYYDLSKPPQHAVLTLTPPDAFAIDATISPHGGYVAYVRDQNLHVYDLAARADRALTQDGAGAIKNGLAEFVAQEEMGRSSGYWWAPDDRHVAFVRVDESPVKVTQRFEIAADNVETFAQRYPATGGPNVSVRLGVSDVRTGEVVWIDLGSDPDIYLARVDWLPDGNTLAIQRESRDQRRLDLLFADIASGVESAGAQRDEHELDRAQ